MEKAEVISKIEKLLTLANNSAATDNEVEQALNHVARLVSQYGINMEEVHLDKDGVAQETYVHKYIVTHDKIYNWEKYLLHRIADTTLCQMLYGKKCVEKGDRLILYSTVEFCGRSCDIALAQYLYNYLRAVIIKRSKGYSGDRDEYCRGIVYGLQSKLDNFRVACNALVPVGLDDYVEELYPHIRSVKGYRRSVGHNFVEGVAAASDISLHTPIGPIGIE